MKTKHFCPLLWKSFLVGLLIVGGVFASINILLQKSSVAHASPTFTLGTIQTAATISNLGFDLDGPPYPLPNSSGTYDWYVANGAGQPNDSAKMIGPLTDPGQTVVYANKSINNIPSYFNYTAAAGVYKDQTSGYLVAFTHVERWLNPPSYAKFYASVGLSYSSDNGNSWNWMGEIFQSNWTWSAYQANQYYPTVDAGKFDYILVNPPDDPGNTYFYTYQNDYPASISTSKVAISVSRAKVSDVVNAALQGQPAPAFSKYYNGGWTQPGLGGAYTPVLGDFTTSNEFIYAAQYNTYLQQYLLLRIDYDNNNAPLLYVSSDPLNFNNANPVNLLPNNSNSKEYYNLVGTGTNTPAAMSGQTFYLYWKDFTTNALMMETITAGGSGGGLSGRYYIVNQNSHLCLSIGANDTTNQGLANQWECVGAPSQYWSFQQQSNGAYYIVSLNNNDNKCLSLSANSTDNDGRVNQWDCVGAPSQYWSLQQQSNGTYYIVNQNSNKCLSISANRTDHDAYVNQWDCVGAPSQYWTLQQQ